jgi:hypothetical protein
LKIIKAVSIERRVRPSDGLFDSVLPASLGYRRQLDNLCGLKHFTGFRAPATDAMASDREGAMQVSKLFLIHMNRLLAAPAETFNPRRITQSHPRRVFVLLDYNLDLLLRL